MSVVWVLWDSARWVVLTAVALWVCWRHVETVVALAKAEERACVWEAACRDMHRVLTSGDVVILSETRTEGKA